MYAPFAHAVVVKPTPPKSHNPLYQNQGNDVSEQNEAHSKLADVDTTDYTALTNGIAGPSNTSEGEQLKYMQYGNLEYNHQSQDKNCSNSNTLDQVDCNGQHRKQSLHRTSLT